LPSISLYGKRLGTPTVLFVGWFGPRGIASVLYLLLVANMLGVEGYERILSVIVLTVLLSVFLHGISALPLSNRYGKIREKVNQA
jgi:NhaP-type Na+/H+ or K+/H+ antiporter